MCMEQKMQEQIEGALLNQKEEYDKLNQTNMTEYDVKRLALVLSIQARIEGMKLCNAQIDLMAYPPKYTEQDFRNESYELEKLAYSHNEQL